jgi:hypothetical protein
MTPNNGVMLTIMNEHDPFRQHDAPEVQDEHRTGPDETTGTALGGVALEAETPAAEHGEQDMPRVEEPEYPVVWPHTVGAAVRLGAKVAKWNIRTQVRNPISKLRHLSRRALMMRKINGEGSEILADKYPFIELVGKMGYNVPKQMQTARGESLDDQVARAREVFPNDTDQVICKPPQGSGGKRIVEVNASNIPDFLSSTKEPYIVQEKVPHELEIRYARDIDHKTGKIHRVYFEKAIPKIEGDGVSTTRQLIKDSDLGFGSRMATYVQNRGNLRVVMPEGGKIHVSKLGGTPTQTPEWGPGHEERVANVDKFMNRFLGDLQTEIGHPLPLLCFDIGFRDASVLDKPYDFDAIKASMVPFECQMPFTITGYIQHSRRNPSGEPGK